MDTVKKDKILIVEDEKIVALDIKNHLQRFGYEVLGMFSYAEETVEYLQENTADLILMDVKLKGAMDGIDAANIIRDNFRIPVVILTAFADEKTLERARITGSSGYIIKPFEERELRITVELALYRNRMQKKLYEREQLYSATLNNIPDPVIVTGLEGRIYHMNACAERISSRKMETLESLKFTDLFRIEESPYPLYSYLFTPLNEERDTPYTVEVHTSEVPDLWGREMRRIYSFHDVTERQKLEHQLRHSQKMEAVGRLAGGVAHDFNNVLTIIMGFCNLILDTDEDREGIISDVKGIQKAARSAVSLTRQLLVFSRNQVLNIEKIDLATLMRNLEKMLYRLITEDIHLNIFIEEEPLPVSADPGQIEQILINLIVNARDAMKGGGRIGIILGREVLSESRLCGGKTMDPGDYIRMEVEDTGTGIPEEVLSKIYEPFFTTKGTNQGTGLGLSTVYGIVEQSGGFIDVKTELGKGTRFLVYLPEVREDAIKEYASMADPLVELESFSGQVLVVEDDDFLRNLIQRMLETKGLKVVAVLNGEEALQLIREKNYMPDLLISDVVMPKRSGIDLFNELKEEFKGLKVLLMSGYPENVIEEKYKMEGRYPFIRKPFDAKTFSAKIAELFQDV